LAHAKELIEDGPQVLAGPERVEMPWTETFKPRGNFWRNCGSPIGARHNIFRYTSLACYARARC
jgi:hypothetical protein